MDDAQHKLHLHVHTIPDALKDVLVRDKIIFMCGTLEVWKWAVTEPLL